jgi:saccharopine dehydrogenase-like NADP-dependent oxidoreductase
MKQILVLGAGQSSPFLIRYLLDLAEEQDWFVTVGDIDLGLAETRVNGHGRGSAISFDINDATLRSTQIAKSDVVVNMLGPAFQDMITWECVAQGRHMVSASYRSKAVRDLHTDAQRKGIVLLCELGLDPGIDHMSAMSIIHRLRGEGGRITSFCSYGTGIPAPDQEQNPLRYAVTWNPRNVVMAGEGGAQYMESGKIKIVPPHQVFMHTWPVEIDGVGSLEAYANRDSLSYMKSFGLPDVETMIRGTLRYPGWSETWAQIVRLGLPNENLRISNLAERSYREVVEMFLPLNITGPDVAQRIGRFLHISPTGRIVDNMRWLGLLSEEPTGCKGDTAAAMLVDVLERKLPLKKTDRDMVILVHDLDVDYPGIKRAAERIRSTMNVKGEPGGFTAMAKTVGLPTGIAVRLLLTEELSLTGSQIPTHPSIYEPTLRELKEHGIEFEEHVTPLQ